MEEGRREKSADVHLSTRVESCTLFRAKCQQYGAQGFVRGTVLLSAARAACSPAGA